MAALAYFITTLRDRFEDKERGATAVEYGLLLALVALVLVGVLATLDGPLNDLVTRIGAELTGTPAGTP